MLAAALAVVAASNAADWVWRDGRWDQEISDQEASVGREGRACSRPAARLQLPGGTVLNARAPAVRLHADFFSAQVAGHLIAAGEAATTA